MKEAGETMFQEQAGARWWESSDCRGSEGPWMRLSVPAVVA